jgi:hypothetical protein
MANAKQEAIAVHAEEAMSKASDLQHVEGSALLVDKQGGVRRLPVPSDDPNDPLNWKLWEKAAVVFCCCWFCKLSISTVNRCRKTEHSIAALNGLAMTSGLGSIIEIFFGMYAPQGYAVEQIALLLTMPSLCIGLGECRNTPGLRLLLISSKATSSSCPYLWPLGDVQCSWHPSLFFWRPRSVERYRILTRDTWLHESSKASPLEPLSRCCLLCCQR